jgi:anti-sigma B factor antagonist
MCLEGERDVVVLTGEIDVSTAGQLRSTIGELLDQGRHHLLVDLEGVTFVDAAGMGALIDATRHVAHIDGSLHLTYNPRLMQLLRLTGETHRVNSPQHK